MVEREVREYTANYQVDVQKEVHDERSTFITLTDKSKPLPPVTVHSVDDRIYSVRFLNNEFFEEPDETLWHVLASLLKGSYEVKKSLLRRQLSIKVLGDTGKSEVLPERIYGSSGLEVDYARLPEAFSAR